MKVKKIDVTFSFDNGDTIKKVINESLLGTLLDVPAAEIMTKAVQASTQIVDVCKKEFAVQGTLPFGTTETEETA